MRAIQVKKFGEPEVLELCEIPDLATGPGQILIKIHAAGVNPVDTYIRSGTYPRRPALPFTPGSDAAGVVTATGPNVTGFFTGQRVYLSGALTGTYAEAALCEPAQVHPLSAKLTFAQGAALGVPYLTAHYALFSRAAAQPGETVLIHGGTGGVGLAAIQFARAAGLTVFATGGTDAGLQLARAQGAHEAFDHTAPGYLDQIRAKAGPRGIDVILEMLANVNLANDLTLLAPGGRIAIIGNRGEIQINPRELMARSAAIYGVMLFAATPEQLTSIHQAIRSGIESGTLHPIVSTEFPLSEAPRAHRQILTSGARGKIVLLP